MAICECCERDMTDNRIVTCSGNRVIVFPDGTRMPAIPYQNPYFENDPDHRCHDCNIKLGGYHHPGCDVERCPKCGGQLISCGCLDEEREMDDQPWDFGF